AGYQPAKDEKAGLILIVLRTLRRDTTLPNDKKIEILLWDKHRTERELIKEMLTKIGCNVAAVRDEHECLRKFRDKKYNLVIFDQGLPDLDVRGFVDDLGEIDELTPVAMMATLDVEFYEQKYGDANIDFLIVRPFELVQLRNLVEEAMRLCQRLKGRA
ncbi:MAG: response regulator, partial [Deltaproteobacteria bacterium]